MANIRVLQDRPAEAIEFYRQALKARPKNVAVLNNLATLLAEQPEGRNQALECIDQAIDLAGQQPGFLDTKGMALFYSGKVEAAVKLLRAACDAPHPDPRYCFHLAAACARLDQLKEAGDALRKARDGGLEAKLLTQKDRQLLADLDRQIGR
jgi:Flp pilus assembly protein TadD